MTDVYLNQTQAYPAVEKFLKLLLKTKQKPVLAPGLEVTSPNSPFTWWIKMEIEEGKKLIFQASEDDFTFNIYLSGARVEEHVETKWHQLVPAKRGQRSWRHPLRGIPLSECNVTHVSRDKKETQLPASWPDTASGMQRLAQLKLLFEQSYELTQRDMIERSEELLRVNV